MPAQRIGLALMLVGALSVAPIKPVSAHIDAVGPEISVSGPSALPKVPSAVAIAADDRFAVAWGQDCRIFIRALGRTDRHAAMRSASMPVSPHRPDLPSAWWPMGGSWSTGMVRPGVVNYGLYAKRCGPDGSPRGDQVLLRLGAANPAIGMAADGRFVLAWESGGDIIAQRYDADGTPRGTEFRANSYLAGVQSEPVVGMSSDGRFVIVWTSTGQDGSYDGVDAQSYTADGSPRGAEFRVNTQTWGYQNHPAVSMGPDGRFVISWRGLNPDDGSYGVRVTFGGQAVASGQAISLPPGTSEDALLVTRATPGKPTTVPLVVVDGCGSGPRSSAAAPVPDSEVWSLAAVTERSPSTTSPFTNAHDDGSKDRARVRHGARR